MLAYYSAHSKWTRNCMHLSWKVWKCACGNSRRWFSQLIPLLSSLLLVCRCLLLFPSLSLPHNNFNHCSCYCFIGNTWRQFKYNIFAVISLLNFQVHIFEKIWDEHTMHISVPNRVDKNLVHFEITMCIQLVFKSYHHHLLADGWMYNIIAIRACDKKFKYAYCIRIDWQKHWADINGMNVVHSIAHFLHIYVNVYVFAWDAHKFMF